MVARAADEQGDDIRRRLALKQGAAIGCVRNGSATHEHQTSSRGGRELIHVNATLQLLGTSPTDAASCFADAPNAAAGRQGKAIQLVSVVTRVRRVPGLAALLALAMLLTQAFVAPFPLGFAANGNPLALAAVAPSPRPTCGDMGANCGHPGSPHTVDCPSGADCAVMHGWVGVLAQHLPTPAPLATSYFAARLGRYAGSSTVPPIPPPRHLV